MSRPELDVLRFVRLLVATGVAVGGPDGSLVVEADGRKARLRAPGVRDLATRGLIRLEGDGCRPLPEAKAWLRRATLKADPFAAQHRETVPTTSGAVLNLEESPLLRLARPAAGEPAFLEPHQVEAGERVRRLAERAQLLPRVTMSYDAARTTGSQRGAPAEISDLAADARHALNEIPRLLPRDCAGVVLDVCALHKGLQQIEQERGWPRRSAKLVLRIGLDQLARSYGLGAEAVGVQSRRARNWLDEGARPHRFE